MQPDPPPPERIAKLAEKIQKDSKEVATPVPQMRIPNLMDLEIGRGIGDIMVMLTMIPGLKAMLPDWTIRIITERPEWALLGHDYAISLKEAEALGTRGEKHFKQFEKDWTDYDLDAIGEKLLRHELFARRLGVTPVRPKLNIQPDIMYWAKQIIDNTQNRKVVGVAPYATSEQRTWPDENWVLLLERLLAGGYKPIMIGGPGEGERSRFYPCVRFWGMGPQRTAAMLAQCNIVVGNDSGMAHVASMLDIPTIVIGAPTDTPRIFGWYGKTVCVQARSECSMCYWRRGRRFRQECNYRCRVIGAIEPAEVYKTLSGILDVG